MRENAMRNEFNFLIYRSAEENVAVNAVIKDDTIWLTQRAMGELLGVQTPAISKHLRNIFDEGELDEDVVVSKMEITTLHGAIPGKTQTRETQFYSLMDASQMIHYELRVQEFTYHSLRHTQCS